MYWQCTDESLSPRRKQNHTTKFFTEVTQFYSFILSRHCLRRSGQSRREKNNKICVKIEFFFFSISSKNNVGGSVNHKIKKVWPYVLYKEMLCHYGERRRLSHMEFRLLLSKQLIRDYSQKVKAGPTFDRTDARHQPFIFIWKGDRCKKDL